MTKKETDTSKEEELEEDADTDEAEEESDDESEDEEESEEDDSEEDSEDEEESSHADNDIDFDAEIEKERERGKPDKDKAKEAYLDRKNRRSGDDEDEEDDTKPMTKGDLRAMLAASEKRALENAARQLAKSYAHSDKEATLIVEKWKNRVFPEDMSLQDQVEEMFVSVHRKKLIGDRNEALRALKNKGRVNNNAATSHHDGQKQSGAPKVNEADKRAILAAGYKWNNQTRFFEKKLPNGSILVYDPKSKKTQMMAGRK